MRGIKCHKHAYKTTTSEAIEMDFGLLVIRNIPCYICKSCFELFCSGDVAEQMEKITEHAEEHPQQVTIVDYTETA